MNEMLLSNKSSQKIEEMCNNTGVCFLGETDSLINYSTLSTFFNVTGTINSTSQANKWLHFRIDGKELYISKVAILHSVSWNHLYNKGLVYGTNDNGLYPTGTATNQLKTITIAGKLYKCRLLKGADPGINQVNITAYDTTESRQSEWSRLFYPIITDDSNMSSYTGPMLANYVEADLQTRWVDVETTPGTYNWCQERNATDTTSRVVRGTAGSSYLYWYPSLNVGTTYGWRPVLELIS